MRLDEIDLQPRLWVEYSGWPMEHGDIAPYYARAEALLGLPSGPRLPLPVLGATEEDGIEPRLLLVSHARDPGLLEDVGPVGRFLQEHPYVRCAELAAGDALEPLLGFRGEGMLYRPHVAFSAERQRSGRVLNGSCEVVAVDPGDPAMDVARQIRLSLRARRLPPRDSVRLGVLAAHGGQLPRMLYGRLSRKGRLRPPTRVFLQAYLEQGPDPANRLVLAGTRDRLGLPTVRCEWALADMQRRTAAALADSVGAFLERAGLTARARTFPWLNETSGDWRSRMSLGRHLMGTTRMARTSDLGVVDGDCRLQTTSTSEEPRSSPPPVTPIQPSRSSPWPCGSPST